mgnify:CR=1 FL=1
MAEDNLALVHDTNGELALVVFGGKELNAIVVTQGEFIPAVVCFHLGDVQLHSVHITDDRANEVNEFLGDVFVIEEGDGGEAGGFQRAQLLAQLFLLRQHRFADGDGEGTGGSGSGNGEGVSCRALQF